MFTANDGSSSLFAHHHPNASLGWVALSSQGAVNELLTVARRCTVPSLRTEVFWSNRPQNGHGHYFDPKSWCVLTTPEYGQNFRSYAGFRLVRAVCSDRWQEQFLVRNYSLGMEVMALLWAQAGGQDGPLQYNGWPNVFDVVSQDTSDPGHILIGVRWSTRRRGWLVQCCDQSRPVEANALVFVPVIYMMQCTSSSH